MTPPTWLDAAGRRRQFLACWTCGREVAPMRYRAADVRRHGWAPPQTLQIPDWCGCSTEYLPVPAGDGWWSLVPIWEPSQTLSPPGRWEPAVPYWAADPGPQPERPTPLTSMPHERLPDLPRIVVARIEGRT